VATPEESNLLRLLEECLERCGVRVREEPLAPADGIGASRGGMCTINEKRVVFIDPKSPVPERAAVLAEALAALDLRDVFLPPLVRAAVERASRGRPL
jgi:hypothetical protein